MISFLNAFVSYGIVLLIFVVVGALAVFVGITLRKRKNAAEAIASAVQGTVAEEPKE